MLAGMDIPRVVADWAECTWLYDAIMCVTTSPMQRAIAEQLQELGAYGRPAERTHGRSHTNSVFQSLLGLRHAT